ncbi:MAG: tetratricopeptide repeat protein [Bacteroidia bacterium]|nr:tetratricopeptide repeat protein [Bacteroidia bacterium]
MLKSISLALVFCFTSLVSLGQLDKTNEKKIKKVKKCYKKEKYEEAGELLREVMQEYPVNEGLWNFYQEIYSANFKKNYKPGMRVSVTSDGGDESLNKMLEAQLNRVMEQPKYDYLNAVNDASMYLPFNMRSDIYMRNYHVDSRYLDQSKVSDRSAELFNAAEKEFAAKNFEESTRLYKKALDADSTNYKALLYLGDSYYQMGYFGESAKYFRKAMVLQPYLNEPVKYLADALDGKGEKRQAIEIMKQSLLVYPEESMILKLDRLLSETGSLKVDRNWVLRLSKINTVDDIGRNQFFEEPLHFQHYINALEEVKEYYNEQGLLKDDAPKSMDTYLEVHCWKQMLNKTKNEDIPALDYARLMQEKGMLAPYLLINLFSIDLYDQYRHVVENDKTICQRYINEYLITN